MKVLVSQILKVPHLVDQNGVAQVQVRGGRIKSRLHTQGPAAFQALRQIGFRYDLLGAARYQIELFLSAVVHDISVCLVPWGERSEFYCNAPISSMFLLTFSINSVNYTPSFKSGVK